MISKMEVRPAKPAPIRPAVNRQAEALSARAMVGDLQYKRTPRAAAEPSWLRGSLGACCAQEGFRCLPRGERVGEGERAGGRGNVKTLLAGGPLSLSTPSLGTRQSAV